MSDDEDYSNAASFKLSTLRTIAADPQMKPIDVRLFTAYTHFMKWPNRQAYLSNIKAMVMTGNTSQPTISASRARLLKFGYLVKVMDKLNGSGLFELNNPRQEIVEDSIKIAEENLKEWDAERKERDRKKAAKVKETSTQNNDDCEGGSEGGVKETYTQNDDEGKRNYADRVKEIYDNSLDNTLDRRATKEEDKLTSDHTEQDSDQSGDDYPPPEMLHELHLIQALIKGGISKEHLGVYQYRIESGEMDIQTALADYASQKAVANA